MIARARMMRSGTRPGRSRTTKTRFCRRVTARSVARGRPCVTRRRPWETHWGAASAAQGRRRSALRDSRDGVLDDGLDLAALDLVPERAADLSELSGVRRRGGLHEGEVDFPLAELTLDLADIPLHLAEIAFDLAEIAFDIAQLVVDALEP